MPRGTNLPALGGYNQTLILDLVRRSRDGVSRVELAEQTGLSAQTISNVSRRLLDDGLIREGGKQIAGPGKPRTILHLEPTARYAVGVHLDPTVITYVVLDLEGRVVAHARTDTPAGADPESTLRQVAASIRDLLETSAVDLGRVLGVGVAAPGPIDAARGTVVNPPLLLGWHDVPLRDFLSASSGFPVLLEKDVTAAAVAERWMAHDRERDNFLFFYYGTGVGAGVALDGDVLRGASSNAGDIGHLIIEPDGLPCRCGNRGCLGDSIVPATLVAEATTRGVLQPSDHARAAGEVDAAFSELATLAQEGESQARSIVDAAAARAARGVLTMINLFDIDTVVFGGPFWERISVAFLARLPDLVSRDRALTATHRIEYTSSTLGDDVAAIGAACLVLDHAYSPRATALLIGD